MKKGLLRKIGLGFILLLVGGLIGASVVGARGLRSSRWVFKPDHVAVANEIAELKIIEEQIEIQEKVVEEIVANIKIDTRIPRIPQLPETVNRTVLRRVSFFHIIGRLLNLATAVLLIGIGVIIYRKRAQPKEKQPEY